MSKTISIRLGDLQYYALKKNADKKGTTITDFVREIVQQKANIGDESKRFFLELEQRIAERIFSMENTLEKLTENVAMQLAKNPEFLVATAVQVKEQLRAEKERQNRS